MATLMAILCDSCIYTCISHKTGSFCSYNLKNLPRTHWALPILLELLKLAVVSLEFRTAWHQKCKIVFLLSFSSKCLFHNNSIVQEAIRMIVKWKQCAYYCPGRQAIKIHIHCNEHARKVLVSTSPALPPVTLTWQVTNQILECSWYTCTMQCIHALCSSSLLPV